MRAWRVGVPLVFATAGLLFTTSAVASRGNDLRKDRLRPADVAAEQRHVADAERAFADVRAQIDRDTAAAAASDASVREAQQSAAAVAAPAGLVAMRGPGLVVSLDDAPTKPGRPLPHGAGPDDVVVHQQDVQAVVNGLWAGGAEAMTLMGERVVATSAVRCVGNTLLLNGRVYSPPFVIKAIGDPKKLQAGLDGEPNVQIFTEYVAAYGLGFDVGITQDMTLPAYDGPVGLAHATAAP